MESSEIYNIAENKAFQDIWKDACAEGFKNFFIYQNRKDFHRYIPEEVYGVFDCHGNFIGDLLETSNPQPMGFRGNLLVKRPKFFYCTYSLGITETS